MNTYGLLPGMRWLQLADLTGQFLRRIGQLANASTFGCHRRFSQLAQTTPPVLVLSKVDAAELISRQQQWVRDYSSTMDAQSRDLMQVALLTQDELGVWFERLGKEWAAVATPRLA
jgi:hypothetical protein